MAAGIVIGGLGLVLAAVAGFAYLNKKAELAIAKADIQYAHEKLVALETTVQGFAAKLSGVVLSDGKAFKSSVVDVISKVRAVFSKHV